MKGAGHFFWVAEGELQKTFGFFPGSIHFGSVGKGDRRRRGAGHAEVHGSLPHRGLDCRQMVLLTVLTFVYKSHQKH